jgi:hypothetical protein
MAANSILCHLHGESAKFCTKTSIGAIHEDFYKFLTATALAMLIVLPAVSMAGGSHSTVNKSISIDDNSTTGSVDSVNGSIRIGDNSLVNSVESVNGSVELGKDVLVHGDLIFEHAVELKLHDTARMGEIIGNEVKMVGSS